MKTIWKFPLRVDDAQTFDMPQGAEVLSVQLQRGQPCAWAIVDDSKPLSPVTIQMRGTWHPLGSVGKHVGTFQLHGGDIVFHAFASYTETRIA